MDQELDELICNKLNIPYHDLDIFELLELIGKAKNYTVVVTKNTLHMSWEDKNEDRFINYFWLPRSEALYYTNWVCTNPTISQYCKHRLVASKEFIYKELYLDVLRLLWTEN